MKTVALTLFAATMASMSAQASTTPSNKAVDPIGRLATQIRIQKCKSEVVSVIRGIRARDPDPKHSFLHQDENGAYHEITDDQAILYLQRDCEVTINDQTSPNPVEPYANPVPVSAPIPKGQNKT